MGYSARGQCVMVDRASGHPWADDPSIVVEIQAARERHKAERTEHKAAAVLHVVDPTIFQGQPLPERRWIVPDWVPQDVVTGLYGVGGIGKSLLAQQLMTATALGKDWRHAVAGDRRFLRSKRCSWSECFTVAPSVAPHGDQKSSG